MSNVQSCTDRDKEALLSYLYEECGPAERDQVEAHLEGCPRCADEVKGFRAVRDSLDVWTPPEPALGLRIVSDRDLARASGWRQVLRPVVGLAAAAGVVLGVALALGGAELRYENDAVVFRVGRPAPARPAAVDQDAVLRQVQGLISESERRQQRERALWLTEFAQELDMQRRADQQQLQQELGALEGYADYLVRVSR